MKVFGIFYTNDFCVHILPQGESINANVVR